MNNPNLPNTPSSRLNQQYIGYVVGGGLKKICAFA